MSRKLKNTLALFALLLIILIVGGAYIFLIQANSIEEKEEQLGKLMSQAYNTDELNKQLKQLQVRADVLDSILAARKFNIPQNLSPIKFFNFINSISSGFSAKTQVDVEFIEERKDKEFFYHEYKVAGNGPFNDVYQLIYAIEQSKELKKVKSAQFSNSVFMDENNYPMFFVTFNLIVAVYFADNDRFTTREFTENRLDAGSQYDIFYPLIRNEIPPNIDGLLDVQGAKLLALVPEGAFIADAKGETYLLWEGEQVYLGYLTKIDYEKNKVFFILNRGGIIEKVELELQKEEKKSIKK